MTTPSPTETALPAAGQDVSPLVELIARAIDPDSWTLAESGRYAHLPQAARDGILRTSLEQASRVAAALPATPAPGTAPVPAAVRPGWDDYFLNIADVVATRADCTRRQVAAVITDEDRRIVSTGYNGAPSGRPGCLTSGACPRGRMSYDEVPAFSQYAAGAGACIALHAEVNAVLFARRNLTGCTIYITCQPCPDCAKVVAGAGLARVVYRDTDGSTISKHPYELL